MYAARSRPAALHWQFEPLLSIASYIALTSDSFFTYKQWYHVNRWLTSVNGSICSKEIFKITKNCGFRTGIFKYKGVVLLRKIEAQEVAANIKKLSVFSTKW